MTRQYLLGIDIGTRAYLKENPDAFDPKKYNAQGREKVKRYVMGKILVCGSNEKAKQGLS